MGKRVKDADAQLVNLMLHTRGQRDRLLAANRRQGEAIFALTAGLREVHAILRSKASGHTEAERIDTASRHIVGIVGRFGSFLPPLVDPETSTTPAEPRS